MALDFPLTATAMCSIGIGHTARRRGIGSFLSKCGCQHRGPFINEHASHSSNAFVVRASTDGDRIAERSKQQAIYDEEEESMQKRMQELAESMILPASYLSQLPNDLQRDLKDAAFALSNGPLQRECGDVAAEILMQLSLAWEKGDLQVAISATEALRYALPQNVSSRAAIGRRLVAAGRCFASTGYYAGGELQKISKALAAAGEALFSKNVPEYSEQPPQPVTRLFKFGDLQVEVTAQKCFLGCGFALGFGSLSWGLTSSLQNMSGNKLQYANDNALLLATSLRGTLLLLGYSCTLLSCFAVAGLLGLGVQLSKKESS